MIEFEKRQLYIQIDNALQHDNKPSVFLNKAALVSVFGQEPFHMLKRLQLTKQSPQYHPEGSVWNHTMLVLDEAANVREKSKSPAAFMWAALLHDIGKPDTTKIKKSKITSYDHDKLGAKLSKVFLHHFIDDNEFINRVAALVRWHMQILFVVKDMPYADIPGMKRETDIDEIALLGYCDRIGRLESDKNKEQESIKLFLTKCNSHKQNNRYK